MDMYFGSGIDDLMVPNRSDRLPSPDSWSKWGVGAAESFPIDNNGIMYDPMFADEEPNFNREGFFSEAEMEDFVHDRYQSSSSSVNGGLSEDSFRRSMLSGPRPDYQLNELASPGQMDDIFLSSLLEDLPGVNNVDKSICYSPKSQGGLMQSDHFSRDTKFSVENVSSGMQNKGYLTTHTFSPSYALGNDDATTSAEQKDYMTAKATSTEVSIHSEQSCMDSLIDDDTPLEESVLQELKMVMNQFTEKTRICFRDSLYRLANNSKQHDMTPDQDEDLSVEVPHSWTHNAETIRSGTKKLKETETNFVDRAIANLMFNKRDFHTEDLPLAPSSNSNRQVLLEEAEAPFFDGKDVYLTSNSSSGNKSSVEDFGSMAE